MRRVEVSALSAAQRQAAFEALDAMLDRLWIHQVEQICAALASREVLIDYRNGVPIGCSILADTTLRRCDLVEAAALELRLRAALGEAGTDEVIAVLGQPRAVISLLAAGAVGRLHERLAGGGAALHSD